MLILVTQNSDELKKNEQVIGSSRLQKQPIGSKIVLSDDLWCYNKQSVDGIQLESVGHLSDT